VRDMSPKKELEYDDFSSLNSYSMTVV